MMDQKQIARHMMEFNKAIFDSHFRSMALLQAQTENYISRFLERVPWIPDDGKKAINEWVNTYKKGIEDFKAYAEDNYKKVTDYFANAQMQEEHKDKKRS
jgi:hypothetical protein